MAILQKISETVDGANHAIERSQMLLSRDGFQRHWVKILVAVLVAWSYIDLRYECEASIFRINQLKEELNDARYTTIARWGELTGKNKPDIVRRKVAAASVELESTDEPPIRVK